MTRLTRMQVALIAAAASVLTSTMHAGMQAIFAQNYGSLGPVMGYVIGRVLGDIPLAIVCFGVVYGFLGFWGLQPTARNSSPSSMSIAAKEQYVLHYLALIDIERVIRSLDYLQTTEDAHLREVLFRDAVICYAKPFSGNRSISGKGKLRVSESFVPQPLLGNHKELISLRDQLFAHMDLDRQAPQVTLEERNGEKHMSFAVVGYESVFTDHLLDPLRKLSGIAQSFLHQKLQLIERNA